MRMVLAFPLLGGCLAFSLPPASTTRVMSVAAGDASACGLYQDGYARCWSDKAAHPVPTSREKFDQIDGGNGGGYCGVTEEGKIACFGENVAESPLAGTYDQVVLGGDGGCAITATGELACWGAVTGPPSGTFASVSVGKSAACAISDQAELLCWGSDAAIVDNAPTEVALDVSVGVHDACILDRNANPVCWGDGAYPDVEYPPRGALISISVGTEFACGLTEPSSGNHGDDEDSAAQCWGSITSDDVSGSAVWTQLSAGTDLVCIANTGVGACYGNVEGESEF